MILSELEVQYVHKHVSRLFWVLHTTFATRVPAWNFLCPDSTRAMPVRLRTVHVPRSRSLRAVFIALVNPISVSFNVAG